MTIKLRQILSCMLVALLLVSAAVLPANAVTDNTQSTGAYYNENEGYATYSGNDLGATYTKTATTFKVWAPTATAVVLNRFKTGSDSEAGSGSLGTVALTKNTSNGVWSVTVNGDLNKTYYTYNVTVAGKTNETQDVYSTAVGVNGDRSMVVDLSQTNPDGWASDRNVRVTHQSDAVIWEIQVRDFSISETSGISAENRGKYLAFTESGTKVNSSGTVSTCVDYLVSQGVNYVHLNPVYDFATVDESKLSTPQYNWGYDPKNYNAPDGSFSTDPFHGEVRIKEFKEMVKALHDRGIGVIMDVVYNHVYSTNNSCFQKTVPNYYYRMKNATTFGDSTDLGHVMASDKTMYRKYMIDSVSYWVNEYHVDGFRFDLMGCHDITTMNNMRTALDNIDSKIIMYGEPWPGYSGWSSDNNCIPQSEWCIPANASKISTRVSLFNGTYRDALKGSPDNADKGYIQGDTSKIWDVRSGMLAGSSATFSAWARQPSQVVTYNSAHDNYTLWDKLLASNASTSYDGTDDYLLRENKLSAALVFTSQGIPFTVAGEEFARTKRGDKNSYKSADSINRLDWTRQTKYADLLAYYKGLKEIRRNYSPFRDPSLASINTTYLVDNGSALGYTIRNTTSNAANEWGTVAVLVNPTTTTQALTLQMNGGTMPSSWVVVANGEKAGLTNLGTISGSSITIPARSSYVLVDSSSFSKLTADKNVLKTVTVKHVDLSTGSVLKTTTSPHLVGSKYKTTADSALLLDYNLANTTGTPTGTVTGDVTVTYSYSKDAVSSYNLTVKYVNSTGGTLAPTESIRLKEGSEYTTEPQVISGYELNTDNLPTNIIGTLSVDTTVTYVYKIVPSQQLKVHYYNKNNWATPYIYAYDDSTTPETKLLGLWPGAAMTSEGGGWWTYPTINVAKASVIFTNAATGSTKAQEPAENQPGYEVSGEVWIDNSAVSFGTRVVVSYVDTEGNKLTNDAVVTGTKVTSSSTYTTNGISGHGTPVAIIGGATGPWSIDIKNVIYVYPVLTGPTITYVRGDANGDGTVDLYDVLAVQKHLARIAVLTGTNKLAADVDSNTGDVDLNDVVYIQRYVAAFPNIYNIEATVTVAQP
ncbi:hypothetical protein AGMMS50284_0720 [Clostridia bacterium]|nr:hypothetical protein AGMMS50284_0720 [Clostridia bacterium]